MTGGKITARGCAEIAARMGLAPDAARDRLAAAWANADLSAEASAKAERDGGGNRRRPAATASGFMGLKTRRTKGDEG